MNSIFNLPTISVSRIVANHRSLSSADLEFNDNPLDSLSLDKRSLIERVVVCQDQFEMPPEDEVTRVLALAVSSFYLHNNSWQCSILCCHWNVHGNPFLKRSCWLLLAIRAMTYSYYSSFIFTYTFRNVLILTNQKMLKNCCSHNLPSLQFCLPS